MACSKCKNKKKGNTITETNSENNKSLVKSFLVVLTKIMLFLVSGAILTVIVVPFSIYLLFKSIFIDSSLDTSLMMQAVRKIASKDITTIEKTPS
jgi:hypothetical protein